MCHTESYKWVAPFPNAHVLTYGLVMKKNTSFFSTGKQPV